MTGKVLLFASSKGGVGKSTVALGVARALAGAGRRVMLADLDFESPCLDLLCKVEDRVLYTGADVAQGICSPKDALLRPYDDLELYLLPAVFSGNAAASPDATGEISPLKEAVDAAAEEIDASYVLLDTGAGVSRGLETAAALAQGAVVVAGHTPAGIRSAGYTGQRLLERGITELYLVINPFDVEAAGEKKRRRHSMLEIIDGVGIPLLGVVPYDYALLLSQEGRGGAGPSAAAFFNIAARLEGQDVPLFSGLPKIRKQKRTLFR